MKKRSKSFHSHARKYFHAFTRISAKEKKLFWIRFTCLSGFALVSIIIGVYAKEIEHLSFALIGVKFCDTCGEALSEAIASVEE